MPHVSGPGWSEQGILRWLRRHHEPRGLARGFGNDAAVLARSSPRPTVCVDQTIEGVHYEPGTPPTRIGHKACARALSDLAATAAKPRAVLAALSLPREVTDAWIRRVLGAIARLARAHGADLVGGDLAALPASSRSSVIAVTALGDAPPGRQLVSRAGARTGQVVVVTGALGGSSLGRHLSFEPRFAEARWLVRRGATAMMDVSDGFGLDLSRLAEASGVGIDVERVPVHRDARRLSRRSGRSPFEHALSDGEDHELIATLPSARLRELEREAGRRFPGLTVVGRVRKGSGVRVPRSADSTELVPLRGTGGWTHGA